MTRGWGEEKGTAFFLPFLRKCFFYCSPHFFNLLITKQMEDNPGGPEKEGETQVPAVLPTPADMRPAYVMICLMVGIFILSTYFTTPPLSPLIPASPTSPTVKVQETAISNSFEFKHGGDSLWAWKDPNSRIVRLSGILHNRLRPQTARVIHGPTGTLSIPINGLILGTTGATTITLSGNKELPDYSTWKSTGEDPILPVHMRPKTKRMFRITSSCTLVVQPTGEVQVEDITDCVRVDLDHSLDDVFFWTSPPPLITSTILSYS